MELLQGYSEHMRIKFQFLGCSKQWHNR